MDAKTQAEYDRIKAGPHSGEFTLLYYKGPVVEHTENVMERVADILSLRPDKPVSQQFDRLRHIYPVSVPVYKAYQEAIATAEKAFEEAIATQETIEPAEKVYEEAIAVAERAILVLIPNCAWDGKTILR